MLLPQSCNTKHSPQFFHMYNLTSLLPSSHWAEDGGQDQVFGCIDHTLVMSTWNIVIRILIGDWLKNAEGNCSWWPEDVGLSRSVCNVVTSVLGFSVYCTVCFILLFYPSPFLSVLIMLLSHLYIRCLIRFSVNISVIRHVCSV